MAGRLRRLARYDARLTAEAPCILHRSRSDGPPIPRVPGKVAASAANSDPTPKRPAPPLGRPTMTRTQRLIQHTLDTLFLARVFAIYLASCLTIPFQRGPR